MREKSGGEKDRKRKEGLRRKWADADGLDVAMSEL